MHRIVVLGAGYAGLPAANRIARQTYRGEVELILVSTLDRFVERPRLHQLATGQPRPDLPLTGSLAPGVQLRVGTVDRIDTAAKALTFGSADVPATLEYDTVLYAVGSTIDVTSVPGVEEHAESVTDPTAAVRIAEQLRSHPTARVVVCGGGLTGLELASEVAESFPRAEVTLITAGRAGDWLSPGAQRYVNRALDALGVQRLGNARVTRAQQARLATDKGVGLDFDVCLWAGGFTVPRLAAAAGLPVDPRGRVRTDSTLRVLGQEDVYAVGDAAAVPGPWGDSLAMGCRTGAFTGPTAADAIVARLSGGTPREFRFRYVHECLSLGRRHAIIQFLDRDGTPTGRTLRGRPAKLYKNAVLDSARWVNRHPGPYLRRGRRHVVPGTSRGAGAAVRSVERAG